MFHTIFKKLFFIQLLLFLCYHMIITKVNMPINRQYHPGYRYCSEYQNSNFTFEAAPGLQIPFPKCDFRHRSVAKKVKAIEILVI